MRDHRDRPSAPETPEQGSGGVAVPHTEPYADLGGLARGDAYDANGAITRPCIDCGAVPGEKCTFAFQVHRSGTGLVTERKTRHMPCKSRLTHTEGQ